MKSDEDNLNTPTNDELCSPVDLLLKSLPMGEEQKQQSKAETLELVDIVSKVVPTDMQDAVEMASALSDSADQLNEIVQSVVEVALSGL